MQMQTLNIKILYTHHKPSISSIKSLIFQQAVIVYNLIVVIIIIVNLAVSLVNSSIPRIPVVNI